MPDAYLEWNGDFQIDANGGLLLVDGDDMVRQRLQRRLFTAVKGYVWHPEYGAGLPQRIGDPYGAEQIAAIVSSQLALEASVAPSPPAQLDVRQSDQSPGAVAIDIKYWDAKTGTAVSFTIST